MAKRTSNVESKMEKWREEILTSRDASSKRITVCGGTVCLALASGEVASALEKALEQEGMLASVEMKTTGCPGLCDQGPLVTIYPQGIFYTKVKPEDGNEIISKTVKNGEIIERLRGITCFKMVTKLPPQKSIDYIEELIRFDFSRKDNAFFYKKIAEIYCSLGQRELAHSYLDKGLQLDQKLPGVKKLKEKIGYTEIPVG